MRKSYKPYTILFFVLLLAFVVLSQYHISATKAVKEKQTHPNEASSARPITGHMLSMTVVNMNTIPAVSSSPNTTGFNNPGKNQHGLTMLTSAASGDIHSQLALQDKQSKNTPNTPPLTTSFQGVNQSYCPPRGYCPPPDQSPDMALATSSNWVLQGVNRWFAVYSVSGSLQPGWPKSFQSFFGAPDPAGCTAIPDLFNPRAFYDANDQRFWAAALDDEHPHGKCTSTSSQAWIAVSQTNNPNGMWNVYSFDVMQGTQNFGDFTQFGYDQQAVYVSCDMFTQPSGEGAFQYENTYGINKAAMEAGQHVTPYGFTSFVSGGVQMNGIQPVEAEAYKSSGPNAGLFISSFDYNSGGGECVRGCSGLVVWAIANPGTPSESLSSLVVPTTSYSLAPNADQPGCTYCIGTLDTGINSTPTWRNGQITFGLVTGVNNGTQQVAGIFWGQINVTLGANGNLTSGNVAQSGYFSFSGDTSAFCPALMTDVNGNLYMVFTKSNNSLDPSAFYAVQPAGSTSGTFPDGGQALMYGQASTTQPRWADYSAADVNGVGAVAVWIASEYEASNQTWATSIGKVIAS